MDIEAMGLSGESGPETRNGDGNREALGFSGDSGPETHNGDGQRGNGFF